MKLLNPVLAALVLGLCGCSALLDFDCADDADCANLAGGSICVDGACVSQTLPCDTPEELLPVNVCSDVLGVQGDSPTERAANFLANRDDFVLISVHPPHGGFSGLAKGSIEATVGFAIDDINNAGGGFTSINGKYLAALICEDGVSVEGRGVAAAQHAVGCGAVAMVGTYETEPTLAMYRQVARATNTPLISPGAISPEVETVRELTDDGRNDNLLWRIKVPGEVAARAAGQLVQQIGAHTRIRVLYQRDQAYGEAMYRSFREGLCLNSTFCADVADEAGFGYPETESAIGPAVTAYLNEGAQAGTDLVVTFASGIEALIPVLTGVADADPNPDLITVEGARSDLAIPSFVANEQRAGLACRAIGISSGTIGPGRDTWDLKLRAEMYTGDIFAPTASYVDAVFVTAFAIAAAAHRDDGDVTTTGILNGLRLLSVDGNPERSVAVHQWDSGIALLTDEVGSIDYQGASGGVDLVASTNDVSNQRTEAWRYGELRTSMAGGQVTYQGGLFELPDDLPLTDDDTGEIDPSVREALVRDYETDPVCANHPYIALVPNPDEPAEEN